MALIDKKKFNKELERRKADTGDTYLEILADIIERGEHDEQTVKSLVNKKNKLILQEEALELNMIKE